MAADHITWAKYRNNATLKPKSSFINISGDAMPNIRAIFAAGGVLITIFADRQSNPRKVLLFLGFCYNSLKQ
ncbi:MAG: hypothetical protein ACI8XU_000226 [Kiritimatiellia bacterium]|jgi:hypothetical protein